MQRISEGIRAWFILISVGVFLLASPVSGFGSMGVMTDQELATVTGHGFSSFTLVDGVARADFNIVASTYTEIDSVKLGYWDNGQGKGWDQNWTSVKFGGDINDKASDLVMKGFFIQAEYDNIGDSVNRQLKSIRIGSDHVTGDLRADFQSLSRMAGGLAVNNREAVGIKTYRFNDTELSLSIELAGPQKGVWVNFGNAVQVQ